jgi:hypothetical protein
MIISQPACACLVATWQSLWKPIEGEATDADPIPSSARTADTASPCLDASPAVSTAPSQVATPEPIIPEPASAAADTAAPLTASERRARAAALRALAFSRGRRFDAAQAAFVEAARLDPALDLTRTPSFWRLERAAHEAAIAAYVETGRERDAAVLRAQIHSTYRPKPLRPRHPAPAIP